MSKYMKKESSYKQIDQRWQPVTFASQMVASPSLSHVPSRRAFQYDQSQYSKRTITTNMTSCSYSKSKTKSQQTSKENTIGKQNISDNFINFNSLKQKKVCYNHSNKQAVYQITSKDGQVFHYCQKCTILVASQGFKVRKFEMQKCLSPRQHQIQQFEQQNKLLRISLVQLQCSILNKRDQTQNIIEFYQKQYRDHSNEINNYFQQINQTLIKIKKDYFTQILDQKQSLVRKYIQWREILKDVLEQILELKQTLDYRLSSSKSSKTFKFISQNIKQLKSISSSYRSQKPHQTPLSILEINQLKDSIRRLLPPNIFQKEQPQVSNFIELQKYLYQSIRNVQRRKNSTIEQSNLLE